MRNPLPYPAFSPEEVSIMTTVSIDQDVPAATTAAYDTGLSLGSVNTDAGSAVHFPFSSSYVAACHPDQLILTALAAPATQRAARAIIIFFMFFPFGASCANRFFPGLRAPARQDPRIATTIAHYPPVNIFYLFHFYRLTHGRQRLQGRPSRQSAGCGSVFRGYVRRAGT